MDNKNYDAQFMLEALKEAEKSANELEVPVGAVIVLKNKIIAYGRNHRETHQNALSHAELEAINNACKELKSWRLLGCTIYITLEPCPMCAGAIINSRIARVVYGANDPKAGSCGTVTNLFDFPYNHKPQLTGGVLEKECSEILTKFFKNLRNTKTSAN